MNNQVKKRGRPPKPTAQTRNVVDWLEVPVLCDVGIVCCILGKQYESVRRMMISGELPGFQVGNEWRVRKDALMAHLGYLPWEIERYGYGLPVDRQQKRLDEQEAGVQVLKLQKAGRSA